MNSMYVINLRVPLISINVWRFLLFFLSLCLPACHSWTKKQLCESCEDLDKSFVKGLVSTSRDNFGGGNTAWEESRLGSFKYSETRLVTILEKVCSDGNRHKDTCHQMVEEHEELIEKWWSMKRKGTDKKITLHTFLCINELKVCCPPLKFGSECKSCPGIVSVSKDGKVEENACSGHGHCDGAGVRTGNGTCDCDVGYEGDVCTECADDYFNNKNATDNSTGAICEACHTACSGGCTGPDPENCTSGCSSGWEWQTGTGDRAGICTDIDECANTTHPVCSDGQYCVNEPGSHKCSSCYVTCSKCRGSGADNCTECALGYQFSGTDTVVGPCEDINECVNQSICTGGKVCTNTPGSYTCTCSSGKHENEEGVCEEDKKEEEEDPSEPSSEETKSDDGGEKEEHGKTDSKDDKTENTGDSDTSEFKHEEL